MKPDTAQKLLATSAMLVAASWLIAPLAIVRITAVHDHAAAAVEGDITGVVDGLSHAVPVLQTVFILAVAAVTLFLTASTRGGLRTRWTRRVGLAASLTALLAIPIGTILGIWGLVHLIRRRREFAAAPPATAPHSARGLT